MPTEEQLDHWFTYHPPTEDAGPKYAAIGRATATCVSLVLEQFQKAQGVDDLQPIFREITGACHGLAHVINTMAPESADKAAAIRCVRLARMAANETVLTLSKIPPLPHGHMRGDLSEEQAQVLADRATDIVRIFDAEMLKARWQANSAIACGGK